MLLLAHLSDLSGLGDLLIIYDFFFEEEFLVKDELVEDSAEIVGLSGTH